MKFIALSDTHGQHRSKKLNKFLQENPADVLLFAGDLQLNNFDDGVDFVDWLHELPQEYKVMTFGNHDFNFEYATDRAKLYDDVFVLNNNSIEIEGIKIWGSPYSLPFFDWAFMKPEKELEEIYKAIPENVDVVMTHTPVFSFLDLTKQGILAGSMSLQKRLIYLPNLKYHIGAHIHEGYGKSKFGNVNFINASVLDERYRLVNNPIIFEINNEN